MKYSYILVWFGMFLSGCTSSSMEDMHHGTPYVYQGMHFGYDRDASFKHGVQDGCKTATGEYVKNHELFNNDESYKFGWGEGRITCHDKVPKI